MSQETATLTMFFSGLGTITSMTLCFAHSPAWCVGTIASAGLYGYALAHYK